jgi:hypothetical protein
MGEKRRGGFFGTFACPSRSFWSPPTYYLSRNILKKGEGSYIEGEGQLISGGEKANVFEWRFSPIVFSKLAGFLGNVSEPF